MNTTTRRVGVIGGGLIGLSVAFEAARQGHTVTVIDRPREGWATWAAAGILAPDTASAGADPDRLALHRASADMYPSFVSAIESASRMEVGYRRCGSVVVGSDESLDAFVTEVVAGGGEATMIDLDRLADLAPGVDAERGAWIERDAIVDSRRLHAALGAALISSGVSIVNAEVVGVAPGAVELDGRGPVDFDEVVVTAGAWTNRLLTRPDVQPIKGQVLIVETDERLTKASVLGLDTEPNVYVARRSEREYVIAATVEDVGFDTTVTAGAVEALLRGARSLLPGITTAELVDARAGLRPGAERPTIGTVEDVIVAAGHHRNGILLAPITAATVVALISGTEPPPEAASFG